MTLGVPWLFHRWLRSRRPSLTPLPIVLDAAGGSVVPVVATFSGPRGSAWIAWSRNSLDPALTITSDGLVYKVIRRTSRHWAAIEEVDVRRFGATVTLTFAFRGSATAFTANTGSEILAARVLDLLPRHVPLTDRARALQRRFGPDAPFAFRWNVCHVPRAVTKEPPCRKRQGLD